MKAQTSIPKFASIPDPESVDVLFIAGEHSGDEHAGALLERARQIRPELRAAGIGGKRLEAAGAQLLYNPLESAIVGFVEVLQHLDYLKAFFRQTLDWIERYRPKTVCFVDYPGFNLRLAKQLYQRRISVKAGGNVRLLFYISPQIWAWKAARRFTMAKHLDALGVIFPFEVDCYRDTSLPVQFVGHPFVDRDYQPPVVHDPEAPLLLLPGSREKPIDRILPIMVETFNRLRTDLPGLRATIMYPTSRIRTQLESIVRSHSDPEFFDLLPNSEKVSARAVLTSSGTISLACALAAIPGLVMYKTSSMTYWLALMLVNTRTIGIANIILGKPIHPEFLQSRMQPETLYREMKKQLEDPDTIRNTRLLARELREKLSTHSDLSAANWLISQIEISEIESR